MSGSLPNAVSLTSIVGLRIPYPKFESMLVALRRHPREFFDAFDEEVGEKGVYREKEQYYFDCFMRGALPLREFFHALEACTKVEFFAVVSERYFAKSWKDEGNVGESLASMTSLKEPVLRLHFSDTFVDEYEKVASKFSPVSNKKRGGKKMDFDGVSGDDNAKGGEEREKKRARVGESGEEGETDEDKIEMVDESGEGKGEGAPLDVVEAEAEKRAEKEEDDSPTWMSVIASLVNVSVDECKGAVSQVDFRLSELRMVQMRIQALFRAAERAWREGEGGGSDANASGKEGEGKIEPPTHLDDNEADICVVSSSIYQPDM